MSSTTLADLHARVEIALRDTTNLAFADATIDDAIRRALEEISYAIPQMKDTTLTLTSAGHEISLTSLSPVYAVAEVYWPYRGTPEQWPPNWVKGFRLNWNGATPTLFLNTIAQSQPLVNDKVRVIYATVHTLNGLAEASATTLPVELEELLIEGSAGFALAGQSLDRSEVLEANHLVKIGSEMVASFRLRLDLRRAAQARSTGEPWGSGWMMDKWDRRGEP
jgi:hypothetical protein